MPRKQGHQQNRDETDSSKRASKRGRHDEGDDDDNDDVNDFDLDVDEDMDDGDMDVDDNIDEDDIDEDTNKVNFLKVQDIFKAITLPSKITHQTNPNQSNPTQTPALPQNAIGLTNLKNTCFLNSTMQALRTCSMFSQYVASTAFANSVASWNAPGFTETKATDVTCEIKKIFDAFGTATSSSTKTLDIAHQVERIFELQGHWSIDRQEDAEELWTFLLDQMHTALNTGAGKPTPVVPHTTDNINHALQLIVQIKREEDSPIRAIFSGMLISAISPCDDCHKPSYKFDPSMLLQVPLVDHTKVSRKVVMVLLDSSNYPRSLSLKSSTMFQCFKVACYAGDELEVVLAKVARDMNPQPSTTDVRNFIVCQQNQETRNWKEMTPFGFPIPISFLKVHNYEFGITPDKFIGLDQTEGYSVCRSKVYGSFTRMVYSAIVNKLQQFAKLPPILDPSRREVRMIDLLSFLQESKQSGVGTSCPSTLLFGNDSVGAGASTSSTKDSMVLGQFQKAGGDRKLLFNVSVKASKAKEFEVSCAITNPTSASTSSPLIMKAELTVDSNVRLFADFSAKCAKLLFGGDFLDPTFCDLPSDQVFKSVSLYDDRNVGSVNGGELMLQECLNYHFRTETLESASFEKAAAKKLTNKVIFPLELEMANHVHPASPYGLNSTASVGKSSLSSTSTTRQIQKRRGTKYKLFALVDHISTVTVSGHCQ
ncbi:CSN-associated deubiquitinating enzyme Ubp12 [Blyttiomyces sp. JEL0837]|nr:CSN-associated deubiquitinating enzyme Ubp12 [Blyttiomyces sp. JEL0837]